MYGGNIMEQAYTIDNEGNFIINNYQEKPTFASFLPGIAGKFGIPLWAFYVNRGQGIASFGIKNKDNPIMEFYPANKSYANVDTKGFRTFLKINDVFYEPFRKIDKLISTKMVISPEKLEVIEINKKYNIKIKILYYILPKENFAGLVRKVKVENLDDKFKEIEVLDGIPILIPYGMDNGALKHVSQTITAWAIVDNLENDIPFYRLRSSAGDQAQVEEIKAGNFYISMNGENEKELLSPIVDPRIIFENDKSFNKPLGFINNNLNNIKEQITENQFPSAMALIKKELGNKDCIEINSLFGNVSDINLLEAVKEKVLTKNYFENKQKETTDIHKYYTDFSFTNSGDQRFNGYVRQNFLDNLLRGGFPINVGEDDKKTYHIFSRKHGDLERDYNDFSLEPSYFSQGNGNYRDINQNRRNDMFFNPNVEKHNIKTFFNLIDLQGFNPLVIEEQKFIVEDIDNLDIKNILKNDKKLIDIIKKPYMIGQLYEQLISSEENFNIFKTANYIIDNSRAIVISNFGEGYWIDHWTYNLDLIENYLRIYPDKLNDLFTKKEYKYYESYVKVLPRKEKYQLTKRGPRQYKSLEEDEKKKELIESKKKEKNYLSIEGDIYQSTLTEKVFTLLLNKVASLDPYGLGIEMEANKPGWYDALNGLPGIFGSSLGETAEALKWTKFMISTLDKIELDEIEVLEEVYEFYQRIEQLLDDWKQDKDNYSYWDKSNSAKEKYRDKIFHSVSGKKKIISKEKLLEFYKKVIDKLDYAIENSKKQEGLYNMFYSYEAQDYIKTGKLSKEGNPLVEIKSFNKKPLSNFLEGQVKTHKILDADQSSALHENVLASDLYDKKLKMFRVNGILKDESFEIGRAKAFSPGWLENGSIWLHMEYKYLLELLKQGLTETFIKTFKETGILFQDPNVYKRSIFENSSFILSSLNSDTKNHGRGYIARLSGATAEFIDMWTRMSFGNKPFKYINEELIFEPQPLLFKELFTKSAANIELQVDENDKEVVNLPANTYSVRFLGNILVVYHNKEMKDTFGEDKAIVREMKLTYFDNKEVRIDDNKIKDDKALDIREGKVKQIDIILS